MVVNLSQSHSWDNSVTFGPQTTHLGLGGSSQWMRQEQEREPIRRKIVALHTSQHNTRRYILIFVSTLENWRQTLVGCFSSNMLKRTDRRCCRKTSGSSHCDRSWHRRGTHPKRTQPGGWSIVSSFAWKTNPIIFVRFAKTYTLKNLLGLFFYLSVYYNLLIFTRKRRSESVGGTVWPSLSEVTFLDSKISKVAKYTF